jgi:hypothetical protein
MLFPFPWRNWLGSGSHRLDFPPELLMFHDSGCLPSLKFNLTRLPTSVGKGSTAASGRCLKMENIGTSWDCEAGSSLKTSVGKAEEC